MIVECKHCGAPLDVQVGSAFARCTYCDHTNKVKSSKTLMAESPAGWAPPPVWQPPPQYSAPHVPLPYHAPKPVPMPQRTGCVGPLFGIGMAVGIGGLALWMSGALTAIPFVGVDTAGAPTVATVELAQLASTPLLQATAEGSYQTSQLDTTCRGYIPRSPQLILRTGTGASVRVSTRDTSVDLVMAIHTSDGRWLCDDDSGGSLMPRVTASLPAGDHRVWVGTLHQGESAPFTFVIDGDEVSGTPTPEGTAPDATPRIGEVTLGPEPVDGTWTSTTSGFVEARRMSASCRGWVPVAPHLRITTAEARSIALVTRDNANVDLVMMVQSPSGRVECDDDSGGSGNPLVSTRLEPGRTNVWIGVYSGDATASFQLELTATDVPRGSAGMVNAAPSLGTVSLDAPELTPRFASTLRTEQRISALGARCDGFVARGPELVVLTTVPRPLTVVARGAPGLRLVVRSPDGTMSCVAAERNGDAVLQQTWSPGAHHVWIGAARRGAASYELTLSR